MRTAIAASAAGLLAAAALAACGAGGTAAPTASSAPSSSPPAGTAVQVTAKDFGFTLAPSTFGPGTYTFTMTNDGATTHSMEIDGPGVEDQKAGAVGPGGTTALTVTLQPGTYTLYCPVDHHREMGMQTTFTVG